MRKALVGICGIGYGHSIRQWLVIEKLIQRGAQVAVFCFGKSLQVLNLYNPWRLPFWQVHVPWVYSDRNGIDWEKTDKNDLVNLRRKNDLTLEAFKKACAFFEGAPDVCISDYEPVSANFAYEYGIPLVTIDQQSKFLGYQTPDLGEFSREEERARLSYFFPYAQARFACSFYPIDAGRDKDYAVELVPAPVRSEIAALQEQTRNLPMVKKQDNLALVYFSPYGPMAQELSTVIETLAEFKDWRFIVYANSANFNPGARPDLRHIQFKRFDKQGFAQDLASASCLISTAGHTLLSEAIYLKTPIYAIPLSTYDQHYCGNMVERYQIGVNSPDITWQRLHNFFSNLSTYRAKLAECRELTTSPEISETMLDTVAAIAHAHSTKSGHCSSRLSRMHTAAQESFVKDRLFLPNLEEILACPTPRRSINYATAVVKPTMKCTYGCAACQGRSKGWWNADAHSLTFKQWQDIFIQIKEMRFQVVTISGGEPLLYPSLAQMIQAIRDLEMIPVLNTNGGYLSPKMLQRLCHCGLKGINFSLDSPKPSVHDTLRRRHGAWKRCVEAIQSASAYDDRLWFAVRMVLTSRNLMDLPEMIRLAANLGASSVKLSYLEWGQDGSALLPTIESLKRFKEVVIPCCQDILRSLEISDQNKSKSISIIQDLLYPEKTNPLENYAQGIYWSDPLFTRHCTLPYTQAILYGDGSVLPCNAAEYARLALPGNLTNVRLEEILSSPAMVSFRETQADFCKYCPMPLHLTLPLRDNIV